MQPPQRHHLDKNVSPAWRPPAGLADRKPGMPFSDRLWHWFVCMGGLLLVGGGVAWIAYAPLFKRLGILIIVAGVTVFTRGLPSAAQRNGYRE